MTGGNIARSVRTNDSQKKNPRPSTIDRVIGAMNMAESQPLFGPSVRAKLKHAREPMMSSAPIGSRASHANLALLDLGSAVGKSQIATAALESISD